MVLLQYNGHQQGLLDYNQGLVHECMPTVTTRDSYRRAARPAIPLDFETVSSRYAIRTLTEVDVDGIAQILPFVRYLNENAD